MKKIYILILLTLISIKSYSQKEFYFDYLVKDNSKILLKNGFVSIKEDVVKFTTVKLTGEIIYPLEIKIKEQFGNLDYSEMVQWKVVSLDGKDISNCVLTFFNKPLKKGLMLTKYDDFGNETLSQLYLLTSNFLSKD
jgi:hypothetical protein